jgi:LEA14-like dessication related protein
MAGTIFDLAVVEGDDDVSVEAVRTRWADGAGNETVLVTEVDLTNNMDVEAVLTGFEATIAVNDETFGTNRTTSLDKTLAPGETGTLEIRIDVPADVVSAWLASHVQEDETTRVTLEGSAAFSSAKEDAMKVSFDDEWEFETELAGAVGGVSNCDAVSDEPCLDGVRVTWARADGAVVMDVTATYNNPTSDPMHLGNQTVTLAFGDVAVAKGSTGDPVTLEPGRSEDVTIEVSFEHDGLVSWWPQHVAACESSSARIAFSVAYEAQEEPEPDDNDTDDNQTGGNETGGNQTGGNATVSAWGPDDGQTGWPGPLSAVTAVTSRTMQQDQQDGPEAASEVHWEFPVGPLETGFACNQEDS